MNHAALGTELIRIGSILRLHPHNPELAMPNNMLPLIIAAFNYQSSTTGGVISQQKFPGAIIQSMQPTTRGNNKAIDISILAI
jgi:hypothetical protein